MDRPDDENDGSHDLVRAIADRVLRRPGYRDESAPEAPVAGRGPREQTLTVDRSLFVALPVLEDDGEGD